MAFQVDNSATGSFTSAFSDTYANLTALTRKAGTLVYATDLKKYFLDNGTTLVGIGGGGGGGGANWVPKAGLGPLSGTENDEKVFFFVSGAGEQIELFYKVPSTYTAGTQINLTIGLYSPSAVNVFRFQCLTTLVRSGVDAMTSVVNQNNVNTGDVTNTLANMLRTVLLALTDATGKVNAVSVSANDLLKIGLLRVAPVGTDDAADVRMVPSMTEIL